MKSKTAILLAMHGMPPNDFPQEDLAEWRSLAARLGPSNGKERATPEKRYLELEEKIRTWPRNAANDPYFAASYEIARHLEEKTGCEVFVGFNEFCNPTFEDSFAGMVMKGAEKAVVVTPMMTRGGSHSEVDIPQAIARAQKKYPRLAISYVWPFDVPEMAEFLSEQIKKKLKI